MASAKPHSRSRALAARPAAPSSVRDGDRAPPEALANGQPRRHAERCGLQARAGAEEDDADAKARGVKTMMHNSWKLLKFGSFLYVVNTYVFEVTMCVGPSMLPTFSSAGDIVLVDRISPLRLKIEKGDIVIAQSPTNPRQTVCKRVKGMPGERVRVAQRYSYERDRIVKVPKGRVWLEGDNPKNSTDSRAYGAVPMGLIKGRVFFRLWPLTAIGPVR